ncbi:MAG: family 1 glycosylhydrolase [Clostridia bacterium]|nr:family 1 glycosylhydrolase [Clostridia bacterium]
MLGIALLNHSEKPVFKRVPLLNALIVEAHLIAGGVDPIVTLMHFTSPAWLIKKGGWEAESTVEYFRRYAAYVAEKIGAELRYICTINEANIGMQLAAISKRFMLMAEQAKKAAASGAKKAEGTVQVGMNFEKMMENMKYAAIICENHL